MVGSRKKSSWRIWVRRAWIAWAAFATWWVAGAFWTRGLPEGVLANSEAVAVRDAAESLRFEPHRPKDTGLVFLCGAGVSAKAYAALLRPIAESGHPVVVVKLPWRIAPLESHKQQAIARAQRALADRTVTSRWVLAGHSLGGALACRIARADPESIEALVLIATTHPKVDDLSGLGRPTTKIYGSRDGIAPPEDVRANAQLLPESTRWVLLDGANHSQFGHYGHQFLDGRAAISRERQQERTRDALLHALNSVPENPTQPNGESRARD